MQGQLARLLAAAAEPRITAQVLPFDQGEHDALGGSLTVLTQPDGSEVAYTEGPPVRGRPPAQCPITLCPPQ